MAWSPSLISAGGKALPPPGVLGGLLLQSLAAIDVGVVVVS